MVKIKERIYIIISVFILIAMNMSFIQSINVYAASYSGDYRYWSQGGSDYQGMREVGCWIVAQSKLLYEANVDRGASFNPDSYYLWQLNNGWIYSSTNLNQKDGGNAPVAYANAAGKNLEYLGYWNATDSQLWFNINAGYYTIVYVSGTNTGGSHYVMLDNQKSLETGVLYCYDSFSDRGSVSSQLLTRYSVHNGGYVYKANNPVDTTPPVISNVTISDVDITGYTVSCNVSDNVGVTKVTFPTWTTYNDQDDLQWHEGTISGNTASYRVNISEHGNEVGYYLTHIYAYDAVGNSVNVSAGVVNIRNGYEPTKVSTYNGHIYALFDVTKTWTDAQALCEAMGGHLATITSKEENDVIKEMCANGRYGYYIGATDCEKQGTLKWVTGEEFSYTNWCESQPDNLSGEDYLNINKDGTWNDYDNANYYSNARMGFVLEIDSEFYPVKTMTYNGSEYELYNNIVPWEVAEAYCEIYGGTLACITSLDENNAVSSLISGQTLKGYLLGATDKDNEGVFKWVTGEEFNYTNWTAGEPTNRTGTSEYIGYENYLMVYNDSGFMWNDTSSYNSSFLVGFILEKKAEPLSAKLMADNSDSTSLSKIIGNTITLNASEAGGTGNYTSKFAVMNVDTGKWFVLRDFSSSSTCTYALDYAVNKQFSVTVKDIEGSTVATNRISVSVTEKLSGKLTIADSTSAITKQKGSNITLKANGSGGSGSYTYKFAVLNVDTGKWSVLRDFSSNQSYDFTLNYTGKKQFAVTVKDSTGNTIATNRILVNVTDELSGKLTVAGSTNAITKTRGSKITLTALGSGGSESYTYKFAVLNVDTGKWTVLREFSSSATYDFTLNYTGKKQFAVTVKDSTGKTVATNRLDVNVIEALNGVLKADGSTGVIEKKKGSKINLSTTANGGSGSYTYKFAVLNVDTGKWSVIKDFSAESIVSYSLNYSGVKQFAVTVKDSTGNTIATNRISVLVTG